MGESLGLFPSGTMHSLSGFPQWGREDGSKFLVSDLVKQLKKPTKIAKLKSFLQNRMNHEYMKAQEYPGIALGFL